MQQAETKLVGNLRLDRHEMPFPYNYIFLLDKNLQTARREENRSKKLIIMNSDIVGTFYPLVLSHQVREGQFLAENCRGRFFVNRSCSDPPPRFFWRCTAFNQFNWWMRIQLTALSGFIYWGSIKIAPSTDAKVHKKCALRRNFSYLMSSGHDSSYWSIFGTKLQAHHLAFMTARWLGVKFQPNSGSSE